MFLTRWHDLVADASPRTDFRPDDASGEQVGGHRAGHDVETGFLGKTAERLRTGGAVGHGLDVGILAALVLAQESEDGIGQFTDTPACREADEPHRAEQPLQVLAQAKHVRFTGFRVPVGADALEDCSDCRPAQLRHMDGRLFPANLLTVPPQIAWMRLAHGVPPTPLAREPCATECVPHASGPNRRSS